MTRYDLGMAEKHMKIMYEELDVIESWINRYNKELKKLQADKERLEQRIVEARKFIDGEKERLHD